jgi:two-component sensor histidine kinase
MFDGKYFSNFIHKYFPLKDSFLKAKEDWDKISQAHDKQKIDTFLKNHFFDINFDFDKSAKYTIGNEKGSAIKLMILLQEIIFNAVKYSSFVKKDERFLKINFSASEEEITIKVENRYKPKVKTKTTGLGHVIIENFAKLLNTKPVIKKNNDIYSISITFKNFWGK